MVGSTISHYTILEKLGEGGMGVVYKAHDTKLDRDVALKFLRRDVAPTEEDRVRFLREAQAASRLDHPNICTVYEVDETPEGHVFIAMPLYDGETLTERIRRGALDHDEIVRIASQVGLGLFAAHEAGIVHRDIKSSNIMLTRSGQAKIMDFGLAKFTSRETITKSGVCMGTLAYMSPEQTQGKPVNNLSDIWSFGVVLYEMITGTLPFDTTYEHALLYAINHEPPFPLPEHQSGAHLGFQSILDRCLDKDPQRRFSKASHVVDHLLSLGPSPVPTSRITAFRQIIRNRAWFTRSRRGLTAAIVCSVIAGVVLVLVMKDRNIQNDVIVYEINAESGGAGGPGVTKDVIEYLVRDELEQSSYKKVLSGIDFSRVYSGKIPATEVVLDVRTQALNTEIDVRVQQASVFTPGSAAKFESTYQFSDPSVLLKGLTVEIADHVFRIAGVAQKKVSTFTSSWDAFEKFFEGEKAWDKLDVTTARNAYQQALRIDSSFVLARLRFSDALRFQNAYSEAKANIARIESHLGGLSVIDSLKAESLIALLNGDLFTHVAILREVLNRKPWAVESAYFLAEGYYQMCDIKQATAFYLKSLDIDSNYGLAHNHLGYCYTHLGEHGKALDHFRAYVRLDSTANSYDSYGDGLFSAGYLDSAATAKEKGLSLDPKLSYLYKTLFYIRLFQGQTTKARACIENFRRTAFSNDLRASAEFINGVIDYYLARDDQALEHCLRGLGIFDSKDIVTRDHQLHWLLGLIYLRTGRLDAADRELREMERLIEANRIDATNYRVELYKLTHHLRASLSAKQGNFQDLDKFREELDGPIRTKVKDHASVFDLAFLYSAVGELYLDSAINRPEYAEECFTKSLAYNPNFPFAHHQLWLLYSRTGKPERADEHLKKLNAIWANADPEWKAVYLNPAPSSGPGLLPVMKYSNPQ